METQPDAAGAGRALDEIAQVRAQASARQRTPRWMWQLLGVLSFVWIAVLAVPVGWNTWVSWLALGAFVVASSWVARRTGFAPFEGTRHGRWVAAIWGAGELAGVIAAVVLYKNGAGPWVLVTAGAVMYAGVVLLGPLTERHVGTPTRSLS